MLSTRAPFPLPGSFALLEEEGRTLAVRIMSRENDEGTVDISVQGQIGSTGYRSVAIADLRDASQLTAAEAAELDDLTSWLASHPRTKAEARKARADALLQRRSDAAALEQLLASVPARHFPAAAAARAAA